MRRRAVYGADFFRQQFGPCIDALAVPAERRFLWDQIAAATLAYLALSASWKRIQRLTYHVSAGRQLLSKIMFNWQTFCRRFLSSIPELEKKSRIHSVKAAVISYLSSKPESSRINYHDLKIWLRKPSLRNTYGLVCALANRGGTADK